MIDYDKDIQPYLKQYMDIQTGEIKIGIIQSDELIKKKIETQNVKEQQNIFLKSKNKKTDAISMLANDDQYFFAIYSNLLKTLEDDYATCFRFLYLCTFVKDKTYFLKKDKDTYILETDLKNVLGLSHNAENELRHILLDKKLLIKKDNKIMVNAEYCNIYKLNSKNRKKATRVFNAGMRELYKQSLPREHKSIGMIIPLLKYMHYNENILCNNPEEPNSELIKPLNIMDIVDIIGYSSSNITRFKKKLISVRVGDKPLLMNTVHFNLDTFIVNPYIFYKGFEFEKVEKICQLFNLNN